MSRKWCVVGRRTAEALQRQRQEVVGAGKEASSSPSDSPTQPSDSLAVTQRVQAATAKRYVKQQIPDDILRDEALNEAITALPANYSFEVSRFRP